MAPAAVRFHPTAAQEAEEAYDWYAARNPAAADGSAKSYVAPSRLSRRIHSPGLAIEAVRDATFSRDFRSAWSTCSAATKSKSSPWLMGGAGRGTGGHVSDLPAHSRIQRTTLRAAADPHR